jgi:hypothetical protein
VRSTGLLWRRLTGRRSGRAHRTIRHGGRRFHLEHTVPTSVPYIEGTLTPRPRIVGTAQDFTGHTVRTEAELTFIRWNDGCGQPTRGYFPNSEKYSSAASICSTRSATSPLRGWSFPSSVITH